MARKGNFFPHALEYSHKVRRSQLELESGPKNFRVIPIVINCSKAVDRDQKVHLGIGLSRSHEEEVRTSLEAGTGTERHGMRLQYTFNDC